MKIIASLRIFYGVGFEFFWPIRIDYLTSEYFSINSSTEMQIVDINTAARVWMVLPGKKAAAFRSNLADLFIRVLGGDEKLAAEIKEIGEFQDALPENHPLKPVRESVKRGRGDDECDDWNKKMLMAFMEAQKEERRLQRQQIEDQKDERKQQMDLQRQQINDQREERKQQIELQRLQLELQRQQMEDQKAERAHQMEMFRKMQNQQDGNPVKTRHEIVTSFPHIEDFIKIKLAAALGIDRFCTDQLLEEFQQFSISKNLPYPRSQKKFTTELNTIAAHHGIKYYRNLTCNKAGYRRT